MAHFRKIGTREQAGYDEESGSQILPTGQITTFYLVAGADCVVTVDDESVAKVTAGSGDDKAAHSSGSLTAWEKSQVIRKVTVQASNKTGYTTMHALLNGQDFAQQIGISVMTDQNWRQVGKGLGECSPTVREELQAMSLREAVIRVANDQMQSAISCRSTGFGVYNIDTQYDWCGAFAYWCWAQAAFIHGDSNPIGSKSTVLWSPQRAIDWAMEPTSSGQLLRYKGPSPMSGKGSQEFRDLGWNGYELEAGDIVLVREGHAGGWKHVCLVENADSSTVYSIDGNQGAPQSIRRRERSLTELLPDKSHKLVFVHVIV
jgi:uncharacterized cupin superfamily protein